MAHINFLEPPKFSLRQFNLKNFELNYFWMMVIAGILLLMMFTYGIVQRARIGSFNEQLVILADEARKASGKPVTKAGEQKASIMDALYQRILWAPILNAIANTTPDSISLQLIKGSTGARSVRLEGVGADVLASARYEEDLGKVPVFSKVALLSSVEKRPGGGAAVTKPDKDSKEKVEDKGGGAIPRLAKPQLTFEIQGWLK